MPGRLGLALWGRLICFACAAALLAVTLSILSSIDGWRAYATTRELCVAVGAEIVIGFETAIALGTGATLLALPYVFWRPASALARFEKVSRIAGIMTFLACGSAVVGIMIRWGVVVSLLHLTNWASIQLWACLSGLLLLGTIAICLVPPRREDFARKLAESISGRTTRRLLLIAGTGGLLTGFSGRLMPRASQPSVRAAKRRASSPNILLVTFDALCAEDVSCYGYHLPTTPNIDSLARSSYVFSNCYATCTFTTPSVISLLTGRYPSSSHVYHYGGALHGAVAALTLPNELRAAGYSTAASVGNPGAHPDCLGFGEHFDILPSAPIKDFTKRETAAVFQSAQLAEDVARGANLIPYMLEQLSPKTFGQLHSTFPPALSFQQAEQILERLPKPFFLWVHVFAPHFPYLPEPPYLHRFLQTDELRTHAEFADMFDLTGYTYSPAKQSLVDKGRLRYDEWIAQADGAFGQFIENLRLSGRLDDMAIVVSADHGESFSGGFLGHGGSQQFRPIVHVPLLLHLPGQTDGHEIASCVDQTVLAPTMLEIAGIARPGWMDGESLSPLLHGGQDLSASLAYTQFFVANSAFKPITHGTVGVIDGRHQYVFNLDTRVGALFDLAEAHEQKLDRSLAEPRLARQLRDQIGRRFPGLIG